MVPIFGNELEFLSADGATDISVAVLSSTKFVVAYRDGANSNHGTAKIGTVSGMDITFGTEMEFLSENGAINISVTALSATKFVVAYRDEADSNHGTAKIGTISGTDITFGAETEFLSTGSTTSISVTALSDTKFVVAYRDGSDSDHGTARIGTVSGTDITFGAETEFLSTNVAAWISATTLSTTKFVVAYKNDDSDHGAARVGTVSGTDITFGTEMEFLSVDGPAYISVDALSATAFVVVYQDGNDSFRGTAKIGTVSGTSITFGAEAEFNTGGTSYSSAAAFSATKFVVAYRDVADSNHGTAKIGTVDGTDITFGIETEFLAADGAALISAANIDTIKFIVAYKDEADFNHGTAKVGSLPIITNSSNLYLQAQPSVTRSLSLYLKTYITEQGSGYLQPDSVIFYHPLDDFEEMTQDQVWQGAASFVPGKIGPAGTSAVTAATFEFTPNQSGYVQSAGTTDNVFGFLNEQKFITVGISNYYSRICDISGTTFTWGPEESLVITQTGHPVVLPLSWDAGAETGYVAVLSYSWQQYTELSLVQISGTTATLKDLIYFDDSPNPLYTAETQIVNMDVSGNIPTGHLVIVGQTTKMLASIVTVSGDVLSIDSSHSGLDDAECHSITRIDDTHAVVLHRSNILSKAYVLTMDYDSDLITWGSGYDVNPAINRVHGSDYSESSRLIHVSGNRFVALLLSDIQSYPGVWAQVGEVDGSGITFGSSTQIILGGQTGGDPDWETSYLLGTKLTDNGIYIDYRHENITAGEKYHKYRIATIDGLSVSVGNEYIRKTVAGSLWGGFSQAISPSAVVAHQVLGNATPPDYWAYGTSTYDFNLQATDSSIYPTISGLTRLTTAMWSKNLTVEDTVIAIERGYKIQITPSSIILGSGTVTWNDSGISGVLSDINDGSERFLVMDFEYQGSDNWKLYTSIDGSGWVDQGVQDIGTLTPLTIDTAPGVSGVDTSDGEWIDELIVWGGLIDQFTNTELSNLHELANTYGDTMGLYSSHWGSSTASMNLFMDAALEISSGVTLSINGHELISSESDLYVPSPRIPINTSLDLYIRGNQPQSGSLSLFVNPFILFGASGDLYLTTYQIQSGSAPLFIYAPPPDLYDIRILFNEGHQPINVSGDLFIQGHGFSTALDSFYIEGHQSLSGSLSLFVFAPPPDLYNTKPLYIVSSEFLVDQRLYFGERTIQKVRRSNLDGSDIQDIAVNTFGTPMDIHYNPLDQKLYLSSATGLPSAIERMTLDGLEREWLYTSNTVLTWGIALNPDAGKMYWMDNAGGNLYRANIDIPNGETSGTRTDTEIIISGLDGPAYVAIDTINSKLYFTEQGTTDKVSRCDLDGSGIEGLVSGSMSLLTDIVLDVQNNTMYWCDANNPSIEKANLDGSNREVIVAAGDGLDEPRGLAIDLITRKLYWTEYTNGNLKRCDFDGSNIQTILAGLSLPVPVDIFPHVTTLYTQGHRFISNNANLFIGSGAVAATGNPLDWLIHTNDYNPQLIGTFAPSVVSVNIQLWDITNGANSTVTLTSSGCYEIGNTSRWGWSTANLPDSNYGKHYFYRMISNTSEVFDGQFLLDVPERSKWIYPSQQNQYLL